MACPYTREVWKEVESIIWLKNVWEGGDIEEAFISLYSKKDTKKNKALPLKHSLGILAHQESEAF
jgi:hypothetical protein